MKIKSVIFYTLLFTIVIFGFNNVLTPQVKAQSYTAVICWQKGGSPAATEAQTALEANGYTVTVLSYVPPPATLNTYDIVFYFQGYGYGLADTQGEYLRDYMKDGKGKLFISGDDWMYDWRSATDFMVYMHDDAGGQDAQITGTLTTRAVSGQESHPLLAGTVLATGGTWSSYTHTWADRVGSEPASSPPGTYLKLLEDTNGYAHTYCWEDALGDKRLVGEMIAFNYNDTYYLSNSSTERQKFLQNIADWLAEQPEPPVGLITIQDGYFYDPVEQDYWLPHGIAYQTWNRPLGVWQTFDQIDYDLDEMVKANVNSIRVDFVWKHIEEDGDNIFNWTNYDYLLQAAAQRNIKVFALIGYQWPPDWFPKSTVDDPDAGWYTMHPPGYDNEGVYQPTRWRSDIMSFEDPNARAQYTEFLTAVATRYKDDPTIVAWIVGNEYGYLGLWSGKQDGYDDDCIAAFQGWLSTFYGGDINALNSVWGTSYTSFTEVDMPTPYDRDNPAWWDLVQWREDSVANFTAIGAQAVRDADPYHLISYSTVGMQWGEEDWRYHAEDTGKIAQACQDIGAPLDFWSINNYPWALLGHESQTGQWGVVNAKWRTGLPVLYTETGFTSSETMYPGLNEQNQGILIRNSLFEALETGAIGVHVFTWQDRQYITDREKGFGILYADRRIKPAFWVVRDTYNLMDQIDLIHLLAGSSDPTPDVAFYWTEAVDSMYNRYEVNMQQLYGPLERLGLEPAFINREELLAGEYINYQAIILPRNMRMHPGDLNFIRTTVIPAGVHVYADADLPGMQDYHVQPLSDFVAEVDSIFGIDATDTSGYDDPVENEQYGIDFVDLDLTVTQDLSPLTSGRQDTFRVWKYSNQTLATTGTVYATHPNGNPALIIKDNGTAKAAITTFSLGDIKPDGDGDGQPDIIPWARHYDWLKAIFLTGFGIQPAINVIGSQYVLVDYRICADGSVLISAKNYRNDAQETVSISTSLIQGKNIEAFIAGGIIEENSDGIITITLEPDGHELLYASGGTGTPPASYKAIYYDSSYPSMWLRYNYQIRDCLLSKGYPMLNANELKLWMEARIADGVPSVVILTHDAIPDTVCPEISPNVLIRQYMEAGGKVVWFGDVPFYYQGHSGGSYTVWGSGAGDIILGIDVWGSATSDTVAITADGATWGLDTTWTGGRPAPLAGLTTILAEHPASGEASAWHKNYDTTRPYSGFVRTYDTKLYGCDSPGDEAIIDDVSDLALYGLPTDGTPPPSAEEILYILDAPATVHPMGDKSYGVKVRYDTRGALLDLTLAFKEDGDNGDGTPDEIYNSITISVSGQGEEVLWMWIPDPDQADSDYISTPDGGNYVFYAYLDDAGTKVAEASFSTQLQWGANPLSSLPISITKGQSYQISFEWEDMPEYLDWENTPLDRETAYPGRVLVVRSSKTQAQYPSHYDKVNQVCDWLESLGYSHSNPAHTHFDDVDFYIEAGGGGTIFFDDMESGTNGWTSTGLWHLSTNRALSPTYSWWYGQEATGNYDTGATNSGFLTSPNIDLTGYTTATLTFQTWWEHESYPSGDYDTMNVDIYSGGSWTNVWHRDCNEGPASSDWYEESIDISAYTGGVIQVRFFFDTVDAIANNYEGWYIDDVKVYTSGAGSFSDDFNDGIADGWTQVEGSSRWQVESGEFSIDRISQAYNIQLTGSIIPFSTNYTYEAKVKYVTFDPYFKEAGLIFRYQDTDNFYYYKIYDFYGYWRLIFGGKVAGVEFSERIADISELTEGTFYTLKVDVTGSDFDFYLDGVLQGSYTDSRLTEGKIGLMAKASQLGVWEPQRAYYFIDDDERGEDGNYLNLNWGYLKEFFKLVILPSVYVMNNEECLNLNSYLQSGMYYLLATDGAVAMKKEDGSDGTGRIESIFGVDTSYVTLNNLTQLTVTDDSHYLTHDYNVGDVIAANPSSSALAWTQVTTGVSPATIEDASNSAPALITNTIYKTDISFQDFEPDNATPSDYFYDAWQSSPQFESTIVLSGTRSLRIDAQAGGGTVGINVASSSGYLDLSKMTSFHVWAYDTQGNNTIELKFKDKWGNISTPLWSDNSAVQNQWTLISWTISAAEGGIDWERIASIELYEYNSGTYYFDDIYVGPSDYGEKQGRAFVFNFGIDTYSQLTNNFSLISQRAEELLTREIYKAKVQLKYKTPDPNDSDFVLAEYEVWIIDGTGQITIDFPIPQTTMTGTDNIYWVIYLYPWDSDDPYQDHMGFYTSLNDPGYVSSISGYGLYLAGATPTATGGNYYDLWIAYNTQSDTLKLNFGFKEANDNGDGLTDEIYGGSPVFDGITDPNSYLTENTNDWVSNAASSGTRPTLGLTFKDIQQATTPQLTINFTLTGTSNQLTIDKSTDRSTWTNIYTSATTEGSYNPSISLDTAYKYYRITLSDGDSSSEYITLEKAMTITGYPSLAAFRLEDWLQTKSVTGLLDDFRDPYTPEYGLVPDYDPADTDLISTGSYNWVAWFTETSDIYEISTSLSWTPRLKIEDPSFPTSFDQGDTVYLPIIWENLDSIAGITLPVTLRVLLQDAYTGSIYVSEDFTISMPDGDDYFTINVPLTTPAGSDYMWVAFIFPQGASDPYQERVGLDDTFRFTPDGQPYEPETQITVSGTGGEYVAYSDTGIPLGSEIYTWGIGTFDGNYTGETPPEGTMCFQTVCSSWAGWGVFYPGSSVDLSSYSYLKFWVKSDITLKVEIEGPQGTKSSQYISSTGSVWQEFVLPISSFTGIDLTQVYSPFMITAESPTTFYVDYVRWTN
jgi:hypothetical protein